MPLVPERLMGVQLAGVWTGKWLPLSNDIGFHRVPVNQ